MTLSASARLSEAEVAAYHRDGLVIPEYRLHGPLLAEMRDAFNRLMAANGQSDANVMVCPHLDGYGPQGIKGDPIWLDFATRPEFLDMIQQIVGPDIILWGTTIFGKPAGTGQVIPWHQDAPHWPITPPATTSIWIALDPCTPENGCLRYLPGTHKRKVRHISINDTSAGEEAAVRLILDPDDMDGTMARDVVLQPGQFSVHDTWLAHGSEPNRSNRRRAAAVFRYMPATSHFDHLNGNEAARRAGAVTDYEFRPIYLLRGQDRAGNDFTIGH